MIYWKRKWQTTLAFLPWEPHEQYEKAKRYDTEEEPHRSDGGQCATGEEWRANTNSSSKNEVAGPKWKWRSAVDVSGDEGKIQCYKEQYCIGICHVKSMNQGKLDVVTQEMARVNINILGISELKWTKTG